MVSAGCGGKSSDDGTLSGDVRGDVWAFPSGNKLGGLPGPVYGSQENSRIHWQPWTKESLEMAENSRRLVLAVIALPQQSTFREILDELSSDAAAVALINSTYVPVLIDGDAVREMGILTAELCAEIGSGLQLPLMVWMTPEGNPVAWMPLPSPGTGSAAELLSQSHMMVARTWVDDPGYVTRNSHLDQCNRSERMLQRLKDREFSEKPGADALISLRQLTSLYDPLSRTFDEAGGLFPSGALDLLSMGAVMESLPDHLRDRCRVVLGNLLEDLLTSPMFDPLDGGVFNARRGQSWEFPGFYRDCASQARAATSLLNAYEATGDRRALVRGLGVLGFVGSRYRTSDGLFRIGSGVSGDVGEWLWWHEDVAGILSEEEMAVWMPASGMGVGGNLPPEVDPLREHFRGNAIAFAKTAEEIADAKGYDPERVRETLDRARTKLLAAREKRMKEAPGASDANAVATFRMITAYVTAYRITGETAYRDLAAETLVKARNHFAEGPRLKSYAGNAAESLTAGRAFLYGVAIQAALDVESVTLDGTWLLWAGDLSSTVAEDFAAESHIRECPRSADLVGLPVTDGAMLFDESTIGLLAMSESRLEALGVPLVLSLTKKVKILPVAALNSPILHTDLIQAALMREFGVTYVFGENAPEAMKQALARSPLKGVNRRQANPADPERLCPEPGGVLRIARGGEAIPVESVGEIRVPSLP
jgi:uncharacterized protein YyaL (SSP411 family)